MVRYDKFLKNYSSFIFGSNGSYNFTHSYVIKISITNKY